MKFQKVTKGLVQSLGFLFQIVRFTGLLKTFFHLTVEILSLPGFVRALSIVETHKKASAVGKPSSRSLVGASIGTYRSRPGTMKHLFTYSKHGEHYDVPSVIIELQPCGCQECLFVRSGSWKNLQCINGNRVRGSRDTTEISQGDSQYGRSF